MDTFILVNLCLFLVASITYCIMQFYKRINWNDWKTWVLAFYGFVSGSLLGLISENKKLSFDAGLLFSVALLLMIYTNSFWRGHYEKKADEWLTNNGDNKKTSSIAFLSKLISEYRKKKDSDRLINEVTRRGRSSRSLVMRLVERAP